MKGSTDRCHLLLSKYESSEIHIGDSIVESSTCEKLLAIKIDSKLCFDEHIQDLCNKANRKLRALARANPYKSLHNLQKRKVSMNTFFNAQFNYCSLIWMLHSRQNNKKIKYLHERCLRLIHNDKLPSYEEINSQFSIHHKNIQSLAIEMFQIKHGQPPEIVSDIFAQTTQHCNFRQNRDFRIRFRMRNHFIMVLKVSPT